MRTGAETEAHHETDAKFGAKLDAKFDAKFDAKLDGIPPGASDTFPDRHGIPQRRLIWRRRRLRRRRFGSADLASAASAVDLADRAYVAAVCT